MFSGTRGAPPPYHTLNQVLFPPGIADFLKHSDLERPVLDNDENPPRLFQGQMVGEHTLYVLPRMLQAGIRMILQTPARGLGKELCTLCLRDPHTNRYLLPRRLNAFRIWKRICLYRTKII